jgi:phosphoribosylanthranilate isomerase
MDAQLWERAAQAAGRVVLAGGLGPENVLAAVDAVDPWCVDASRSLELAPGVKDHGRVRAFVDAVRTREAVRS